MVVSLREKLANRRGMSGVFSIIVFMILTLFCLLITDASANALQSSVLLRNVEKAHSAAHSAARFIQSSLKDASDMTFSTDFQKWKSESGDEIVNKILLPALNHGGDSPLQFIWGVEGDQAEAVCPDVRLLVSAEYRTGEELAAVADNASLCKPTITVRISHQDYKMTLRITACDVRRNESGYAVTFADSQGDLRVTASLGAS